MHTTQLCKNLQYTPFEAMFGRLARLPIDFNASSNFDADAKLQEFMDAETDDSLERAAKLLKTEEEVKANTEQAQKKQKEHYNLKHGAAACFNVGSVVLKKDFTRKKREGGKLDYRWEGPFIITAHLGKAFSN